MVELATKKDTIHDVDLVNLRDVIDYTSNKHGEALLDFLIESRMVVTNGRVQGTNNFTSISVKGKSVVDYFVVPIENVSMCSSFNVLPVTEIMHHNNLETFISEWCRPPDHSVFKVGSPLDDDDADDIINDTREQNLQAHDNLSERYKYGTMSPEFLKSSAWIAILDSLINRLENIEKCQSDIDEFYNELLFKVFQEMDEHIEYSKQSKRARKHYKNHKPYWTDELTEAWKNMSKAEKLYIKSKQKSLLIRTLTMTLSTNVKYLTASFVTLKEHIIVIRQLKSNK